MLSSPSDSSLQDEKKSRTSDYDTQHWVTACRIVLSVCLIYYHNHRLVDSYKHNLSIEITDEYETLRSLIKASQRTVLQAGLNLFMAVAGISAFLSLRKRRGDLLRMMGERSKKLIIGFIFGIIIVAIPSNILIQYCGTNKSISSILTDLSLLLPGHLAFLPYLFLLNQVLVPITVTMMNCFSSRADVRPDTILPEQPTPNSFLIIAGIYSVLFLLSNTKVFFWSFNLFISICCVVYGFDSMINLWLSVVHNIYFQIIHSKNGMFISIYTFLFPLICCFFSVWILPHFEFSNVGMILVLLVPVLCCFAPTSNFRPFPQMFPNFYVNIGVLALVSIVAGQLIAISYPLYLPLFSSEPAPSGTFYIEDWTGKAIIQRDFHAIFVMCFAHGCYYLFGFYLMCFEKIIPQLPYKNPLFIVCFSLYQIIFPALAFSPSRDFFYITPGYTTFHYRTRRFWFHFGGWNWVCAVFMACKQTVHTSFEGPGFSYKLLRFLRDNTFGTFLIHPLFGYILCCLLRDASLHILLKIVILDVGVYVLSYAWSHYMQKFFPTVRKLFGTK